VRTTLNLAVEDELSEHVIRRVARDIDPPFPIAVVYGKRGAGYLQKRILAFNRACRLTPYVILTDLDRRDCAPELIEDWFRCSVSQYPSKKHANLVFCIAVREVESWLLADRDSCAQFLGVARHLIPSQPDQIADPKEELVRLAARSNHRRVREEIAPPRGSILRIGPGYNEQLGYFVSTSWRPQVAATYSPSLRRTFQRLQEFLKSAH
jgi:hypothetical protein